MFLFEMSYFFAFIIGLWVFFVTPFFWAYIFGRRSKRCFIYFGIAFLFLVFTVKIAPIISSFGGICFYLLFFSYLAGLIIYMQKSKRSFSLKILFTIIGVSVYFLIFIIFIEGGEIIKTDSDGSGSRISMGELQRDIRKHIRIYKEYPTYEDEISGKLERYHPKVYGTSNTGILYELTKKRYIINDNPNFMVAWGKESHGIIIKWRYVIFVGKKGKSWIEMISEGKFQKLLKQQQQQGGFHEN